MKKYILSLAALAAVLTLVGAGCASQPAEENNVQTPAPTTTAETPKDEFTVSAESTATGSVNVTWNLPSDFSKDATVRLLHSGQPEPKFPGAYWFQRQQTEKEFTMTSVPSGTRYVRACEFVPAGNKCVRFSNEVTVEVK